MQSLALFNHYVNLICFIYYLCLLFIQNLEDIMAIIETVIFIYIIYQFISAIFGLCTMNDDKNDSRYL